MKQKRKKNQMCMMQPQNYIMSCQIYFDEYSDLLDAKRSKMDPKNDPANLILDVYELLQNQMIYYKQKVMKK